MKRHFNIKAARKVEEKALAKDASFVEVTTMLLNAQAKAKLKGAKVRARIGCRTEHGPHTTQGHHRTSGTLGTLLKAKGKVLMPEAEVRAKATILRT